MAEARAIAALLLTAGQLGGPHCLRRMHSKFHPQTAQTYDAAMVHIQTSDGGPANRRPADEGSKVVTPTKVPAPIICPWRENSLLSAGDRVGYKNAVSLRVVTNRTSVAQVIKRGQSPVT
jgi:hypothetical protein